MNAPVAPALDAKAIAELAEQLDRLLKLRTFPIGMKLFGDKAAMEAVPGLRRPARGKTYSTCQLVTQSRMAGFTLGITTDNVPAFSSCSSVIGLDAPGEIYTSGRKMEGVWFENREASAAHHGENLARLRADGHERRLVRADALAFGRVDAPIDRLLRQLLEVRIERRVDR